MFRALHALDQSNLYHNGYASDLCHGLMPLKGYLGYDQGMSGRKFIKSSTYSHGLPKFDTSSHYNPPTTTQSRPPAPATDSSLAHNGYNSWKGFGLLHDHLASTRIGMLQSGDRLVAPDTESFGPVALRLLYMGSDIADISQLASSVRKLLSLFWT
jgi:hypothetical protein